VVDVVLGHSIEGGGMDRLIRIISIFGALFIFWLFYNTTMNYRIQHEVNSIKMQKLSIEEKEVWIMHGEFGNNNVPILYNKATGEAWKIYINNTDIGWTPILYGFGNEAVGNTPSQVYEILKMKLKKDN